jgi:hypothetical protein
MAYYSTTKKEMTRSFSLLVGLQQITWCYILDDRTLKSPLWEPLIGYNSNTGHLCTLNTYLTTIYAGEVSMGGYPPPPHTSIVACLWFNSLVVGWNTTDSELKATDAIVPRARSLGGLLFWRQLQRSTLPELWRVHRLVRGCHTTTPRRLLRRCWSIRGSVGGDRNAWSGRWRRRWWWNTWRRKEAETYGRGCPEGVSQYVETMVPGTCPSNRWAMFDSPSVRSSSPVSCDAGLRGLWSRRHPRLRLRGSHPWVRMVVPLAAQWS